MKNSNFIFPVKRKEPFKKHRSWPAKNSYFENFHFKMEFTISSKICFFTGKIDEWCKSITSTSSQ